MSSSSVFLFHFVTFVLFSIRVFCHSNYARQPKWSEKFVNWLTSKQNLKRFIYCMFCHRMHKIFLLLPMVDRRKMIFFGCQPQRIRHSVPTDSYFHIHFRKLAAFPNLGLSFLVVVVVVVIGLTFLFINYWNRNGFLWFRILVFSFYYVLLFVFW